MNNAFFIELRRCCNEMYSDRENSEKLSKVIEAYDRAISFSDTARKEGLLALEEASEGLDLNDVTQEFLLQSIMLVVDGTDPELVAEIGMNRIVANGLSSFEGLVALMYYKAALMSQSGVNPRVMEEYLKSLMPDFVRKVLSQKIREGEPSEASKEIEDDKELILSLCKDDKEINEKDHSIVNQTAMTLMELSDREMQRLLRDIANNDLEMAMKGLPGKARARTFDNVSNRLGIMLAKDMLYMGPVRMRDVEEACVTIMKTVIKLEERGEIVSHDFAILKVVIDMYETAQKENNELKEKYKELHAMIDQIYQS